MLQKLTAQTCVSLKMTLGRIQYIYGIESLLEPELDDLHSLFQGSVILDV